MKYILNESQLYKSIELYLKSSYPNISEIEVRGKTIGGWGNFKGIGGFEKQEIPFIRIVFEPNTVKEGNKNRMEFKYGIQEEVKNLFGIEPAGVHIDFYEIKITEEKF